MLLTSYLTRQPHPITRAKVQPNQPEMMQLWYPSAKKLGVRAVIFHDQLSAEFVDAHTTDQITFVESRSPAPGWSNNDWRFKLYLDWLRNQDTPRHVTCCDLFDTKLNRTVDSIFDVLAPYHLWSATDRRSPTIRPGTKDGNWIVAKTKMSYGLVPPQLMDRRYYSACLIGGHGEFFMDFLEKYVFELGRLAVSRPLVNSNMAALNYTLHLLCPELQVFDGGEPLHSQPCRNDLEADVCFVHK